MEARQQVIRGFEVAEIHLHQKGGGWKTLFGKDRPATAQENDHEHELPPLPEHRIGLISDHAVAEAWATTQSGMVPHAPAADLRPNRSADLRGAG